MMMTPMSADLVVDVTPIAGSTAICPALPRCGSLPVSG